MDLKDMVFNTARDGNLHQLKVILDTKPTEEISSLVSALTDGATPLIMACKNGHFDVALYLVEKCNADIEQVGSLILSEIYVPVATPLWFAAWFAEDDTQHFNIVKMLVKHNALVNFADEEENTTALHFSCASGHFEIVKYLIEHGADIEIADSSDRTCLMVACFDGYYDVSQYLLECGADMDRKGNDGGTALHDCARTGNLDILKMLLKSGAKSYCNSTGSTPLFIAAAKGHSQVVEYFIHECSCTRQEKVNALELLGSVFMMENINMVNAFQYWKYAMKLRYEDGESLLEKPTSSTLLASYVAATEVRTLHQLEELVSDPDEMGIQALLVIERIFGPGHKDTYTYIMLSAQRYLENDNFHSCMKLWMYAIDVQLKILDTLTKDTHVLLSYTAELFFDILQEHSPLERGLPPVSGHIAFQDVLHLFEINLRIIERDLNVPATQIDYSYRSEFYQTLITAINLIGLMCNLQPRLKVHEITEMKKAVYKFVCLNPKGKNDWTPLHLACCRDTSSFYEYLSVTTFPSQEVIVLLLEVGASPNAADATNNTPLHVAAMNIPCTPAVFKTLLIHGAHLDFCNYEGKTPLQLAESMPFFDLYPMRYINLQCLCAQTIRKHKIAYEGLVHDELKAFLDSH